MRAGTPPVSDDSTNVVTGSTSMKSTPLSGVRIRLPIFQNRIATKPAIGVIYSIRMKSNVTTGGMLSISLHNVNTKPR